MTTTALRLLLAAAAIALAGCLGGCDKCGHVDFSLHQRPHACAAT